jgi:hypothetical protein
VAKKLDLETKEFGKEYSRQMTKHADERIQMGDMAGEFTKKYAYELSDMIKKHEHLEGVYYIYVLWSKDPRFPSATKLCFCSMREKDLNKASMLPSTDLWKIDNKNGSFILRWSIPPKGKIKRTLEKPTDEKRFTWTKEMIENKRKKQ